MRLPTEILDPYLDSAPVDIAAAAADLGIVVLSANLAPNEAINLEMAEDGTWRAYLNRRMLETQSRFAVAHVVAHFVLHRDLVEPLIAGKRVHRENLVFRSDLDDVIERQANRYAASLLLPAALVRAVPWIGTADTMALRIADTFGVNLPVARLRMDDLAIRPAAVSA
jgi:Zn-dependent peptidase ImmA (M78 family)